ncbi:MAG: AmmeMemoRadiSam system protein B [Candidatus Omnitrophota bacterium]
MKKLLLTSLILVLLTAPSSAQVKRADLAGRWYPASKEELELELRSYLDAVAPPEINGEIIALIAPHAGFVYSGPVAAYGFKAIQNQDIETVVVVGFSHRKHYDFIAVLDDEGFKTPLGTVEIDREITSELIKKNPKIHAYPIAFSGENSVEMEIPFLQMVLKDFKIVLIAMGNQSFENSRILGRALYEAFKKKDKFLFVASTDLSHFMHYKKAERTDRKTISLIKDMNPDKLYRESLAEGHHFMCGYGAVTATMIAAKKLGANKVKILKYANSGDTAGDKSSVVGYLSAAIFKSEIQNPKQGDGNMLNEGQKKKMLKLARDSITHYLKTGKRLGVKEGNPVLNKEMGAFVTLHEHGRLRGCIGNIVGRGPFYLTVRDMAVEAATGDPRFPPVTLGEMKDIDIEISALSPLEKIENPEKIVMGKHGVIVRSGFTSGVYLPQVATETGWNREEFMNSLCGQKAGMAADAWKKGKCDIYIFTAEVFKEH